MNEFTIPEAHVGLLYENGAFTRTVPPGKIVLRSKWALFEQRERTVKLVDLRERSLVIKGQEILTKDKVAIRVSLLVYFKVEDPAAAMHQVASYEDRIYEDVQLAARRFLASRDLEAILNDRNEISDAVKHEVEATAGTYGVHIRRADVKDLVFPGNLREIMNQVLETERRAEARLIQAKKDLEAERMRATAEHEATKLRLQAEAEQVRIRAQAELERVRGEQQRRAMELEAAVDEAKAVAANPSLLRLKELSTLQDMARHGASFEIGLSKRGVHLLEPEDG